MSSPIPAVRCAIYTRKSSEEGLDQAFNSLHAQREACEAYVKSQAGERWNAIAQAYDDGGFSGGSMERPALKRLLADIASGRIDIVVVYKIDRLSRSLGDFVRMVEVFDAHKVSFVSVTQAFNTTSSMGRLTLNVLLSFAQFEREVTGERIRDKIAASKRKGMWMGGLPPLGYDLPVDPATRALVVNEAEAQQVRQIFNTYLALGSVHELARWLDERQIRSKAMVTRKGRTRGGQPFSRGALFHMLKNRVYRGMIVHGDQAHAGAHPAIVDEATFEAVAQQLLGRARRGADSINRVAQAPLQGRIFDAEGRPMSPSFTHGTRGRVYRYYVSAPLVRGETVASDDSVIRRISAHAAERLVGEVLARCALRAPEPDDPFPGLRRVGVEHGRVSITMCGVGCAEVRRRLAPGEEAHAEPDDPQAVLIVAPIALWRRGGRTVIEPIGAPAPAGRADPVLIKALRKAHAMLGQTKDGLPLVETAPANPYLRKLLRLAFLSPQLQAAILQGTQPRGLTLDRLIGAPPSLLWSEQASSALIP